MLYVRTCQECGNKQVSSSAPDDETTKAYAIWTEVCCKRCKSPALDYGSFGWHKDAAGNLVKYADTTESE